jgi:hypothetical protein
MTWCDPADPAGWPGKTRLQPVDFCFFTKTTPFWIFFKIGIDPALNTGLKTMNYDKNNNFYKKNFDTWKQADW